MLRQSPVPRGQHVRIEPALIRFGPVQGRIKQAEIVLRAIPPGRDNTSPAPPRLPFEIGAYEVREAWDENRVSWNERPTASSSPGSTVRTRPDAAEVRLDVTASAERLADPDAADRGWLIQVVHPMPWEGPEPGAGAAIEKELLALFPWAESVPEAVRQAHADGKLVLACVRSHPQPEKTSFLEQVLLTAVLADPDVLSLVSKRFVPVRVNVNPAAYTMNAAMPDTNNSLAELGTSLKDVKATALVVSDGDRRVASLTNIGTFDRDLVLRLLLGALNRAGAPAPQGKVDAWRSWTWAAPPTPAPSSPGWAAAKASSGSPASQPCWATTIERCVTLCRWPKLTGRSEPKPRPKRATPSCGWAARPRQRCTSARPHEAPPAQLRPTTSAVPCSALETQSRPAPRGATQPPGGREPLRASGPRLAWLGPTLWPCTRT